MLRLHPHVPAQARGQHAEALAVVQASIQPGQVYRLQQTGPPRQVLESRPLSVQHHLPAVRGCSSLSRVSPS